MGNCNDVECKILVGKHDQRLKDGEEKFLTYEKRGDRMSTQLTSIMTALLLQVGTLIWFLATEHSERVQTTKIVNEMEPKVAKLWYKQEMSKNDLNSNEQITKKQ